MLSIEQPKSSGRHVDFEFYAPTAHEVFLVGEFNEWNATNIPLHRDTDGTWRVELALPPGIYRYKFRVDSEWRCSAHHSHDGCDRPCKACDRCVPNLLGSNDRIVIV